MGAFIVNNSLPCSVWPVPTGPPVGRLTAVGAPPILVIGTTEDPATPLAQARSLTDGFDRGRLLVADRRAAHQLQQRQRVRRPDRDA